MIRFPQRPKTFICSSNRVLRSNNGGLYNNKNNNMAAMLLHNGRLASKKPLNAAISRLNGLTKARSIRIQPQEYVHTYDHTYCKAKTNVECTKGKKIHIPDSCISVLSHNIPVPIINAKYISRSVLSLPFQDYKLNVCLVDRSIVRIIS